MFIEQDLRLLHVQPQSSIRRLLGLLSQRVVHILADGEFATQHLAHIAQNCVLDVFTEF